MSPRTLLLVVSFTALACGPDRRGGSDEGDPSPTTDGGTPADCACGERECGSRPGCSESCGTCDDGRTCSEAGLCEGTPAACLIDTPCAGISDCPPGSRCNHELTPPQCHRLYCGPDRAPCDDGAFCETGLACISGSCGDVGPYEVTGTLRDTAVTLDEAFVVLTNGQLSSTAQLVLTDRHGLCGLYGQNLAPANATILELDLGQWIPREGPSTQMARAYSTNDRCSNGAGVMGDASIEILTTTSTEITGVVSIEASWLSLRGAFRAAVCDTGSGPRRCERSP